MKFYRKYSKESDLFPLKYATLSIDNPLRFRKNLLKMTVNKKIKNYNKNIRETKLKKI